MGKRIVHVVDDEEPIRRSLKMMLGVNGYSVSTFESGAALLDAADALAPGVLLLDVRMPDMDGIEVQRHLAARRIDLPVVVMTGHGDLSLAIAALQGGAVAFLEKPFAKDVLAGALDAAFLKLEDGEAYARLQAAAGAKVDALAPGDRALLAGLASGRSIEAIAADLQVNAATVEVRRARLFSQLGAESVNDALRAAFAAGLGPGERLRDNT